MDIARFDSESTMFQNILYDMEKAVSTGRDVSMMTGTDNIGTYLKYKIGEGMWSPPMYGNEAK